MNPAQNQAQVSLAVLPLQNLSEDRRISSFCTGLLMDLITDLSRFKSFSILPLENQHALPENFDYLVKGIARFRKEKLQVNLQLIQARENRLVWAEKFDGTLDNIFQIEEDIVQKIVVTLQNLVDYDLLAKIRKGPLHSLNAYENWLYGMEELKKGTEATDIKARAYFQEAITLDPGFARAYTGMSLTYFNEWSCLLWDRWEETQKGAIDWALKAVALDERDPANAFILGKCFLFYKKFDQAEYYIRKALDLNPANPKHLAGISFCLVYLGYLEEAMEIYKEAERLDPTRNGFILTGTLVHFENGNFEKAIGMGENQYGESGWIDFPATLAAAYFHVGNMEKMWDHWYEFTREFFAKIRPEEPIDDLIALEWMIGVNPYQNKTHHQPFWDFLAEQLQIPRNHPLPLKQVQREKGNQFIQEGDIWRLTYQRKTIQLADLKGLHDLARLLTSPSQSVHCTDLMGTRILEQGTEVFDEKARKEYQQRLRNIQEDLEEAELRHDLSSIERLQLEYDNLLDHLTKSVGKGGKNRTVSASLEKTRSAVTWRIRSAIKKIAAVHPELAAHLKASVKTGLFCTYQPEIETIWET